MINNKQENLNCICSTFLFAFPIHACARVSHLIQYACVCEYILPPLSCLSPPTVCVGVRLCVCMCSLSDSISQWSRGSCQKVVALVSFARKMSISCTTPVQRGNLLGCCEEKNKAPKPVKFTPKSIENTSDLIPLRPINTSTFLFLLCTYTVL